MVRLLRQLREQTLVVLAADPALSTEEQFPRAFLPRNPRGSESERTWGTVHRAFGDGHTREFVYVRLLHRVA